MRRLTVNVLALVGGDISGGKLTVGGLGCAVTAREVVDDEGGKLITGDVLEVVLDDRDAGTGVTVVWSAMSRARPGKTYIHKKVPTWATLVALAAKALSVMEAAAAMTSLEYSLLA